MPIIFFLLNLKKITLGRNLQEERENIIVIVFHKNEHEMLIMRIITFHARFLNQ